MSDGFRLEFKTDNAAFEGDEFRSEIIRILHEIADDIEYGRTGLCKVRDINGNKIGEVYIPEPDEEDDEEDDDEEDDDED